MAGITFSGIGSGIDTASIIDAMVYSERAPIRQMESKKSEYNSRLSTVKELNSKLQALQTLMQKMSSVGDFLAYSASVTNEDAVSVTTTGESTPGTYKINVIDLAQAERRYSDTFAAKDVAGVAGEGILKLTIDGEVTEIEVKATDTLEDIVNNINASDAEVNAGLFFDGSTYRIQVSGKETGAANAITFEESGTLILNLDEISNRYQQAQDASLTFDGHAVTSSSNTVEDILPGVTIQLKEKTTSEFNLKIEADSGEIKSQVEEFISKYNEIINLIQKDDGSDSTMRSLQMQLSTMIASEIGGLGSAFSAMSQIGISTNSDSTISLDSDDFEDAISNDPNGVAKLFAGTDDESVGGLSDLLDNLIESYVSSVDGILTQQQTGINDAIRRLSDSILQAEDRLESYEEHLRLQFTQMDLAMSQLNSQSSYLANMSY